MASSEARMLSFTFWWAVAVVILAAIWIFGCADPARRGFLEHPKEAGVCLLKIKNETPFAAELRSGSLWWGLRDGLMPHTEGTLPVETGKRYILTRHLDVNGVGTEAPYEFYIAKGMKDYKVIFGGLQTGVLYNRSGRTINVKLPNTPLLFTLAPGQWLKDISVLPRPGTPHIVFSFKDERGRTQYVEKKYDIDDIRADEPFNGEWYDWVKYIDPSDVEWATWP